VRSLQSSRSVASNHDDDGDAVEHSSDDEVEWVGLSAADEQLERDLDSDEAACYRFSGVTEHSFQLAEQYECSAPRRRRRAAGAHEPKTTAPRRARHRRAISIMRDDKWAPYVSYDQATHVMPAPSSAAATDGWGATAAVAAAAWDRPAAHVRGGTASRADVARVTDASYLVQTGLTVDLLAQMMARELTPEDYEILLQLDNAVAKKTVAASTLDNALAQPEARPSADDVCMICLDGFAGVALESIAALSTCKHVFHVECIKSWLSRQSTKCPTCNTSVK
jgi:hypothetical protein